MNPTFYDQLLADLQAYIKAEYRLYQVRSVEKTSELIGLIMTLLFVTFIVVIGLIFLAIAFAAWLEQWLPMWASYLVIAGMMLLIALVVYAGRQIWFIRPIEKQLCQQTIGDTTSLKQQKQDAENQVNMQRNLLKRDVESIQRDWGYIKHLLQSFRDIFA